MTRPISIDRSRLGGGEDDVLLLPFFVGEATDPDKEVGQPLNLKANFKVLKGDILLFYMSKAAS